MVLTDDLRKNIISEIDKLKPRAIEMDDHIFDNPELSEKEFDAQKILTGELKNNGFAIELGTGSLQTAFKAEYNFSKPGPSVAFIAEYDALPKMGHACHHHLIASSSI